MSTSTQSPVVVGVDGSEQSALAIRFAVGEAVRLRCGLRIVHAIQEMVPTAPMLPLVAVETLDQVGHHMVQEARSRAIDLAGDDFAVETVVKAGPRVHILVDASEDARMVVLGHRDRSILGRIFTYSTSTGVAARAHCPMVCVPETWDPDVERRRVVVGVDGSQHSRDALAAAFALAERRGTSLTVVHAWRLPSPYDDIIESRVGLEDWRQSATTTMEALLAEWREEYPEVPVDLDLHHEYPAPALVRASETADVLVLGRRGRGAPLGVYLGSISRTLIREAHCPLMIAPPRSPSDTLAAERVLRAEQVSPQT